MKKSFLLFIVAIAWIAINGQELSPQVLSPGGEVFNSSDYSLSWTLGELVVGTLEQSDAILDQGFFGISTNETTSIVSPSVTEVKFYPNPVQRWLTIEFKNSSGFVGEILVADILGNTVIRRKIEKENKFFVDMESLPTSMYFIQLIDSKQNTIQIKNIIKQ